MSARPTNAPSWGSIGFHSCRLYPSTRNVIRSLVWELLPSESVLGGTRRTFEAQGHFCSSQIRDTLFWFYSQCMVCDKCRLPSFTRLGGSEAEVWTCSFAHSSPILTGVVGENMDRSPFHCFLKRNLPLFFWGEGEGGEGVEIPLEVSSPHQCFLR